MSIENKQSNFLTIFYVALTCILLGGFIGATTNMINASVSPYYFKAVMHWDFEDIWVASVAQGILEGLIYGVIFGLMFTTGFGLITKGQAPYRFAFIQLLKITALVFACWAAGGLLAMLLATLSSNFYKGHFPLAPSEKVELLKFAWVGGSIWGGMIGGLLSSVLGVVVVKNSWTKLIIT